MKLKLISIHIKDSPLAMPLATAMLKASLSSSEKFSCLDIELIDFNLDHEAQYIANKILSSSNNFIGFSIYLWNYNLTLEIIQFLKKRIDSKIIIFAGGAEATANSNQLIKTNLFDFIIKGEGELIIKEVMKRLIKQKSISDIKEIVIKEIIHPTENKTLLDIEAFVSTPIIENLDQLPSAFLSNTIDFSRYKGILWELSRGCLFKCTFCFEGRGIKGVRQFSIERLRKELLLFVENNVTQVWVLDPTFNQDRKRAKKILQMILEIAPEIHFTFEVRAELLDFELSQLFSQISCSLQIGLQSSEQNILKNIQRTFNEKKYTQNIQMLNQLEVTFGLDLIIGLPEDNLIGFKQSLNYAINLQPNHLDIFPLAILSATQLADDAAKFYIHYKESPPYTIISSPTFSRIDIAEAKRISNAVDIFYNKGKAVGWLFMILETINLSPSDFFIQFANYLNPINSNYSNYLKLQINFTKVIFNRYNKGHLFLPMSDIITYHNYLAQSLEINKLVLPELHYNLEDLMYIGEYNLEEFTSYFSIKL